MYMCCISLCDLTLKTFTLFCFSFKKKLTYFCALFLSSPTLCCFTLAALVFIDFFITFVFIDVIKQRFMINIIYVGSPELIVVVVVGNLDCFDKWLLNHVFSIYSLMRFHLQFICGIHLRIISVFADFLMVVYPFVLSLSRLSHLLN